jgi:chromosome segregation ATPase
MDEGREGRPSNAGPFTSSIDETTCPVSDPLSNHTTLQEDVQSSELVSPQEVSSHKVASACTVSGSLEHSAATTRKRRADGQNESEDDQSVAATKQECRDLRSTNRALCERTVNLKEEKDKLEKVLEYREEKISELHHEMCGLKEILIEYQEKWKTCHADMEKLRNQEMENRKDETEQSHKTEQHICTLKTVIHRLKEKTEELEAQKQTTAQEIAALNQQIATLESKCAERSAELHRERKTSLDLYIMYEMERREVLTFTLKVFAGVYSLLFFMMLIVLLVY